MPDHTTIRNLGSINATDIAPSYGAGGIIVPTGTGGDTFAVLNAAQTLTNKTF